MTFSLRARVCALGCAVAFALPAKAVFAHPTTFTADPPVAIAERAVAAADAWLADTAADCARWRAKSRRDVLAIEEAFLEQLRKPRAATIDAGSPEDAEEAADPYSASADADSPNVAEPAANDEEDLYNERPAPASAESDPYDATWDDQAATPRAANDDADNDDDEDDNFSVPLIVLSDKGPESNDDPASDSSDEDLGVWRAIQARLWGSEDDGEPGCIEQLATLARSLLIGYDLPSMELLAAEEASEDLDSPTDAADEAPASGETRAIPAAPVSIEPATSSINPFSAIRFWPAVTDEATVLSIVGPRTTAGLNEWRPSATILQPGSNFEIARRLAAPSEAIEAPNQSFATPAEEPGFREDFTPDQSNEESLAPAESDDYRWDSADETPNSNYGWELDD